MFRLKENKVEEINHTVAYRSHNQTTLPLQRIIEHKIGTNTYQFISFLGKLIQTHSIISLNNLSFQYGIVKQIYRHPDDELFIAAQKLIQVFLINYQITK